MNLIVWIYLPPQIFLKKTEVTKIVLDNFWARLSLKRRSEEEKMFALIESPEIYKRAEETLVNFLINPSAVLEAWGNENGVRPNETRSVGKIFLDPSKTGQLKSLPTRISEAISNCHRVTLQHLLGKEILDIKTAIWSDQVNKVGICKIFPWGFRYRTGSGMGLWQFEWDAPLFHFLGHRNSFLRGVNGLFSYKPEDLEILRLLTSKPNQPLIFQGIDITPREVVLVSSEEQRKEFYLPLKRRVNLSSKKGAERN